MDKRKLHHLWVRLRSLNHWHFLGLTLVSGFIMLYGLRQNNITSVRLLAEVHKVDQENGDIEAALAKLRSHVHSHMNAGLASSTSVYPPIQLKYRYERLVKAEKDRVAKVNEDLYTKAQRACEKRHPASVSGGSRIPCIQDYVTKNAAKEQPIPDDLYKFDFASPTWSPDLSGWSLVLTGLFGLSFLIRFGLELWLRSMLR